MKTLSPKPKYQRWVEQLRRDIQRGELRPGDQLPSYQEMKRKHGVTQPTLDRVHGLLEQEGLITREPYRGVFVAPPHRLATGMIGCLSGGFTEGQGQSAPYWKRLIEGIRAAAGRAGRQIVLLDQFSKNVGWEKVDGVLIAAEAHEEEYHLPPGMVGVRLLHPVEDLPSVITDDFGGAQAATRHLLELGHRRIAYLTLPDAPTAQRRVAGYRAALNAAGITPHKGWVRAICEPRAHQLDFVRSGYECLRQWLQHDWNRTGCTAILAYNDETACGVFKALSEAGLRVPDDVSVVGFDGTEICDYLTPHLTSMEVPLHAIGEMGVKKLLHLLDEETEEVPEQMVLPVRLRARESTAAPKKF